MKSGEEKEIELRQKEMRRGAQKRKMEKMRKRQ